jgi:hypothetical protein
MKTPLLGSSYVARSVNAADARMINLFPEIVPEAGKEPAFLNRAPGLNLLNTIGTGPIRGLWAFSSSDSTAFVVSGTQLFRITAAYVPTLIGTVAGTGPVSMTDNGAVLIIAANGPTYTYLNLPGDPLNGDFRQITDVGFPGAVTVAYLDGYFVFNAPNSQFMFVISTVTATGYIYPLVFDPTEFAATEGSPDGLVAVIANFREVWAFGTNSIEVWSDTGATDFPLQRIPGAFNELGCAAPYSIAKMDNGLFWLGRDRRGQGIVYRANGYAGQRISTHAVEWQIQQYSDLSDAVAYTYQQDGHSFYVLIFPTADTTWVYDVATQAWHERAGFDNGEFTRHRSNCQMSFGNNVIVGDYQNGNIYAFDLEDYSDNGGIQKWLRSWRALPTGQNNLKRTAQHSLQLDIESGTGLNGSMIVEVIYLQTEDGDYLVTESGNRLIAEQQTVITQGSDPEVMLRWSDDGGHTWSNEHWAKIGKIGEYYRRVFWRRLGMTVKLRDRVYELSGTDPVKISIMGAELILSPTNA